MDREGVIQVLDQFIAAAALVRTQTTSTGAIRTPGRVTRASNDELMAMAPAVERILDHVTPSWRAMMPISAGQRWRGPREMAIRARAQLVDQERIDELLGDTAPRLSASQLHPWVWEAARSLWQTEHFAAAVQAAAIYVNAATQQKLGRRDVSEAELFRNAFSVDPPKNGRPRLRLGVPDDGPTYRSRQRGAASLGEALYAGVRNPGAHEVSPELPEHEALEQLAAFSLLARWVDASRVVGSADDE